MLLLVVNRHAQNTKKKELTNFRKELLSIKILDSKTGAIVASDKKINEL